MLKRILLALTITVALAAPSYAAEQAKPPVVLLETNLGTIKIALNPQAAPVSVKNFLNYVNSGFYSGTIFHRVIPGFVIQGGGFTPELQLKAPNPPIKNEADNGLKNDRGTIAMARTGNPNSATSQFFINLVDNNGLNRPSPDGYGYAVFGKVVEGMEVVDKIATVSTSFQKGLENVPVTPVVIKSATVQK